MYFYASLTIILLLFLTTISYIKWIYGYWKRRKTPYIEGRFPFGFLGEKKPDEAFSQFFRKVCSRMQNCKYFGLYFFTKPTLTINDLDLVKEVLINKFNHFSSSGIYSNKKDDPYTAHPLTLQGIEWQDARKKFSSILSSGKLKNIFPNFVVCSNRMVGEIKDNLKEKDVMEIKSLMQNYTVNVIGTSVFGLDFSDFQNEDSPFRVNLKKSCCRNHFRETLLSEYPEIGNFLGIKRIQDNVTTFFKTIIEDTIEYRRSNNIRRNDLFQTMLDNLEKSEDGQSLTMRDMIMIGYTFIRGGFETTSTFLTLTLYYLALNPEIQEKVRNHINTNLTSDEDITYDNVQNLTYLGQVMNECLRLSPPLAETTRTCTKEYRLPGTNFSIPEKMKIMIPIMNIHTNPNVYPNPEKFEPERFDKAKGGIHPMAFIPFGGGPRFCVANRFALLQARVGLAIILQKFRFVVDTKTDIPYKTYIESKFSAPTELWLKVESL